MAIDQSFLAGLRTTAGVGSQFARPQYARSADQNNTISGNQGYATAQPLSWQQVAMQRQQQQQMLAQDPTNIRYVAPNGGGQQPVTYGASPDQLAAAQANQNGMQPGPNSNGMNAFGDQFGMPQNGFTANNGVPLNVARNTMMNRGRGFVRPRGFTPNNLAAGPSGSRFVRPMVR